MILIVWRNNGGLKSVQEKKLSSFLRVAHIIPPDVHFYPKANCFLGNTEIRETGLEKRMEFEKIIWFKISD